MSNEISVYPSVIIQEQALMSAFGTENGTNPIIGQIEEQAKDKAKECDPATAAGRKELASIAYSVAKAKTALDNHGKNLVADAKAKIKIVDNERKSVRDSLDALRDEIRLPVTQFEEAEAARKERADSIIAKCLAYRTTADAFGAMLNSSQIAIRIEEISQLIVADDEFSDVVAKHKAETGLYLEQLLHSVEKQEQQAEELARLKAEEDARLAAERQKKRDEEIANAARQKAERDAAEKVAKAEREAQEAKVRAEREAQEAKVRAEREAQQKIDAEHRKIAAERAAKATEERKQAEAEAARKADEEHIRSVNNSALQSFIEAGIDDDTAKKVICLIAKGRVKYISINY